MLKVHVLRHQNNVEHMQEKDDLPTNDVFDKWYFTHYYHQLTYLKQSLKIRKFLRQLTMRATVHDGQKRQT